MMTLKTIKELNHYMKEEGLMILVDDVNKLIDDDIEKFTILKNTTIVRYLYELKARINGK